MAAFGIPLLFYSLSMAPTVYNLDSAELTIAASTGGLMRATGYPLYLLIGRFWSRIPLGDVGFRMNLLSAVSGALGVWLAYRIMRRLGVNRLAAIGAAGLLAFAPFYWSLSLVAEVYTLHVVMMGVLILLLLRWSDQPTPPRLAAAAFWLALSMGHHLATALLVPGVIFFVFAHLGRQAFRLRNLAAAAIGSLAGLSIYLYLPLLYAAAPVFNYAGSYDASLNFHPVNLGSVSGLLWLVTGKSFASQMFAYRGAALWGEFAWFTGHLGRAFLFVGIGPGLAGVAALFRKDWKTAGLLALMFASTAFFYIDYLVVDKETMFLPTYLVWAIWIGLGYQALAGRIGRYDPPWLRRSLNSAIMGAVVAALIWTAPDVDFSNDTSARERGEEALAWVRQDGVVFGWWDTIPPVQYLQLVEGRRPDVQAINRFLISGEDLYAFVLSEARYRPVYIDSFPSEWAADFRPMPAGALIRLEPRAEAAADGYQTLAR